MNRNLLQLVLRHADGLTAEADADALLLRRFVTSRDEAAFALLVKRHGPMVWAVCRQSVPNHADAEDSFQATFFALAQSAKGIRAPERLAGWLHAAAVRIAAKAKRSFTRRTKHERARAKPESDSPVSAAAWNDLLAAVHNEVSGLPPSLRAVFVLCDLEGVEPAAAAKQLGLKPGTLSGQLARARQRLLAALTKRGLSAGAVTLGTAVTVPEVLANKVAGGVVPSAAVVELASEVTVMSVSKLKLLAAGLLVAGGLTLSGLGWLTTADGQELKTAPNPKPIGPPATGSARPGHSDPPPNSFPGTPGDPGAGGPGGPSEWVPRGFDGGGGPGMPGMGGPAPAPAPGGEFLFVGKPNTVADVAKLLKDKSGKGWEYTGSLDVDPADPPKGKEFEDISKSTRVVLVFKRKTPPMGMGGGGGMMGPGGGVGWSSMPSGGPPGVGGGMPGPAPGAKTPGTGSSSDLGPWSGEGVSPKPAKVVGTWKTLELQSNGAEVVAKGVLAVYAKPMPEVVLVAKGSQHVMVFAPSTEAHVAIAEMVKVLDEAIIRSENPRK
jgi:RNA polymerase sigma factor (sigma-70 family)